MVVRWLGSLISYDAQASGLLTSGGSMANMIALLIAMIAAIALIAWWAFRKRDSVAITMAVFAVGLVLAVHA